MGYHVDFQGDRRRAVPSGVNTNWNFASHGLPPSTPPARARGLHEGIQQPVQDGRTGGKQMVAHFVVELQVPVVLNGFH